MPNTARTKILHLNDVRLFRSDQAEEATGFWLAPRKGDPRALFLYSEPSPKKEDAGDRGWWGVLYVGLPDGYGVDNETREALCALAFLPNVFTFSPGIEIILQIQDHQIESAINLIFGNLGRLSGTWPFRDACI